MRCNLPIRIETELGSLGGQDFANRLNLIFNTLSHEQPSPDATDQKRKTAGCSALRLPRRRLIGGLLVAHPGARSPTAAQSR